MIQFFIKFKILYWHLHGTFEEWKQEVWDKDLDEYHCCSGGDNCFDVCGCGGATVREIYYRVKK